MQNVACSIKGQKIAKRRYAPEFFKMFESLRYRDRITKKEMEQLQLKRLRKSLETAYENSTYYRNLFDSLRFSPQNLEDFSQLAMFPILSKQTIQENLSSMINRSIPQNEVTEATTSGTTGAGLVFPITLECEWETWSIWWRYRYAHGITFDTWCAVFGARNIVPLGQKKPPFWRTVSPTKQIMFSMHHLNKNSITSYVDAFNKSKIPWIHGHPSTISNFASLMLESGLKLDYQIEHISIGSENLLEHQIYLINEAFGTQPIQHYGLTEPVANISMCEHGKLHIDEDYSYVELLPIDNNSDKYRLIGTSFSNDALLFLRYDTNDIITLAEEQQCPCGRSGRIIESIEGRKDDYIIMRDGTKIGRLSTLFREQMHIKEAQIRQEKDGKVVFYIAKSEYYTDEDENNLIKEIEARLDIDYEIVHVDNIPKTKGGKLKFVISDYEGKEK